jgi:hypothetical protein
VPSGRRSRPTAFWCLARTLRITLRPERSRGARTLHSRGGPPLLCGEAPSSGLRRHPWIAVARVRAVGFGFEASARVAVATAAGPDHQADEPIQNNPLVL